MAQDITHGAIESIFKSGNAANQPIVQVIDLKRISSGTGPNSGPPRFRLAISDGLHFQQAMIATQLNSLITDNKLQINSLVRLVEIICNTVQDKRIVIILNVEVIKTLPSKIGTPNSIDAVMNGGRPLQQQNGQQKQQASNQTTSSPQQPDQKPNIYENDNENMPQKQQLYDDSPTTNVGMQRHQQSGQTAANGKSGANGTSWSKNPFSGNRESSSAISKSESNPNGMYRNISVINPYQNGWTIRGRCTYKGELRTFQNSRGDGQVASFELTDQSGSIRITGFSQSAQKINELVQLNHIYKVSRGFLKQANEKYNRSTSSFEMTIDNTSQLEAVNDDGSFMQIQYNFTKIAELDSVDVKSNCDIVGVVTAVGPISEITIRSTGDRCAKRSITLTDDSNASVDLTLWRRQAEQFLTEDDVARHPVLVLHNAMRGDYGGVSLNVSRLTTMELDPVNVPEANRMRAWYDSGGLNSASVQSVTATPGSSNNANAKIIGERKSLVEARVEDVEPAFSQTAPDNGPPGATASFVTRGMVTFVNTKNELYYPGDPETKKKVIQQTPGLWLSESTGKQLGDDDIVWRYIIGMKIADHSSSNWVSAFDEAGAAFFGRSAKSLRELKERDHTLYEHIVEDALCRPMLLKIQVKESMYRDARQIRYNIARAEKVDYVEESRTTLEEIAAYGL